MFTPTSEEVFIFPLSFAQERLWFIDQLDPGNTSYNISSALQLEGQLNIAALERAIQEIQQRHEVLRTSFKVIDGMPFQVIASAATLTLPVLELKGMASEEQFISVQRHISSDARKPFNLSTDSLVRVSLLKVAEHSHILQITVHHIIADVWSIGIFIQELTALYKAFCQGKLSPLPELPIQYADFGEWQRQWLSGKVLESQISYWKQQLAGAPPLLELPTDRPRPPVQTFRGSIERFQFNASLTEQIRSLSQQSGATLFMTLLAAFAVLLSRYSHQKDIIVGSSIANRNRQDIETLIGFFVNSLVLRIDLQSNPTFWELLQQVRQTTLDAYDQQDLPFEQLVEALQPKRSLSHHPLFQVMFVLQNAPIETLELPGLTLTPLQPEHTIAKFDLTLSMQEIESKLVGTWEYNSDLFEADTIRRMMGHFQTLLEAIANNPEQRIGQLPLLSAAQRHQLLVEWNQTSADYPEDKCIHQLFEEQVERSPDSVAVVFSDSTLTYRELNSRANQLAHYLQTLGVKPEVLVGLCVERSLEMVIGLLGILKAGGAYVPIDPTNPQKRKAFIREDTQMPLLLTQERINADIPTDETKVICLDTDWQTIAQEGIENPVSETTALNLAYVIYTSGSTGKPKGTLIPHRGLVNYLSWCTIAYAVEQGSGTLVHSSLAFDLTITSLFSPLLVGCSVELLRENQGIDALGNTLRQRNNLSLVKITPAHLELLNQQLSAHEAAGRTRALVIGGENLTAQNIAFWQDFAPDTILVNEYGPTETVVGCCIYQVPTKEHHSGSIPIGQPIINTQLYVLDEHLQPVPIGVAGELHIGGVGLARGYLNRPDLNTAKFIPNPFNSKPGERLYKTGDLARYRSDGILEYLGRIDEQVKIRGFRIELGEVEAVLGEHPHVREVVVLVHEDVLSNKRLVAYLVANEQSEPSISEIRRFLKEKLPEYMVPSAFVLLEALPLTPNGKVDRQALSAPESELGQDEDLVAPRTPTEEIIVNIFASVLGLQQVGIYNNFFELGGHSLLATQVVSRLREAFQVEIPLRTLFEAPTVAEFDQALSVLRHTASGLVVPTIEPRPRDNEPLPLSWAQERLWFLDQLEGSNSTYNIPAALEITGQFNLVALEIALSELVRRHEVLRTTFVTVNGTAVQAIAPPTAVTIPLIDLRLTNASEARSLPTVEQTTQVKRLVTEEAERPFDLATGPLLRVTILQLGENSYVLLVTMHHIISDGWSIGIFIQELSTLYQTFLSQTSSPLPELPIQYADFAQWQRQWLSGEVLDSQLNYWKQQLAGVPALLELPTDRNRPPVQTGRGSTETFELSAELTQKLKHLSRQAGTTLFMTLQAAYVTLLSRLSGQDDIIIGIPIANRNRREIEPLIGFFVNTLVLRTQIQNNPSFSQLLTQVRQVALDAYAHQDVPFEQVVEALQPERNLSHSPLFQVMFVWKNAPLGKLELPSLTLTPLSMENVTAKFDLTLTLEETQQGLIGSWEYNSDLFDVRTITRWAGHFQTLLEAIVANPEQPVRELPLLTDTQRYQLLVEWNSTHTEYFNSKCIHQLFEFQVKQTPDAVAVVFEEQQLSYWELNCRANQVAHHLQELGVEPEVLVGLCVERSLEVVIGLLGILKAGGAYVPLDPAYPQARLDYILNDSQVPLLLTTEKLLTQLPNHQTQIVCLDRDWEIISHQSEENPVSIIKPDNLAYVIYTSGSTGKPKGVMIQHQSLVNFTQTSQVEYELSPRDRFLQFASISFDTAAEEIYPCLTCGGTLVLRNDEMLSSVPEFLKKCNLMDLTVLDLPTAYWHQLIFELAIANFKLPESLRLVIIGGEGALPEALQMWQKYVGITPRLVNTYGPTEATVVTTLCQLSDLVSANLLRQDVPIGYPIRNVQVYLLDKYFQPVPIGVTGELYIGGAGLARGYLNLPDLTQEKFIPNPISDSQGTRLYKTGDLACYLPDGNIRFLGRIDHQVKVRGFRVELGEIEAVLTQCSQVRETVVIAWEDHPGNKRLLAYIVPQQEIPTASALRSFLKEKLPEYMIPAAFVFLEALPLTPNGKLDRLALPAPSTELSLDDMTVAPRTPTEEIIAHIFASVLGLQQVGIYNNFFELGGHSLLATKVISRLREAFQVEIPLRTLFESPTVAEMEPALCALRQTGSGLVVPFIKSFPRNTEPLPLSWAQERLWFLNQLEGSNSTYNIPAALQITGQFNVVALEIALSELVRRHEVLRTTFGTVNGEPVQSITLTTTVTIPLMDLRSLPTVEQTTQVKRLVTEEAERPFDLATGPLLRVTILQLGENSYVLLVTMHHIISDGWSIGIFIQELSTLYQTFLSQTSSPLPELPIQYADFAQWQRQWLSGEVLDSQLNYWKQQLAGVPALLELPTDRNRPPVQTGRGSTETFELSAELTQQIKHLSQLSGSTLFMTLLAAFALLLSRYSHQEDIVVGSVIANRNRQEIEPLIGFFVNTLVLRTNLEGNPSFGELLQRVRQMTLDAYAHQDLPFEHLVEVLQPERSLSHHPLFQVMFVLQNAPIKTLELPGLTLKPLEQKRAIAKFDLTLSMQEIESKLVGTWEYNSDLFEVDTIRRMIGHFQTLCSAIANNPEQRIGQLPLLSAAQRHQLLVEWNQTSADYPEDKCIHQLFEEQVERSPDSVAVVFSDSTLTYQELNSRANQLAHHLQTLGVKPEVLVGLCVERSLEMVIGLLGILKAGGAYVPLEPEYPLERLAFILQDTQLPILLTQQHLIKNLPQHQTRVVCLDTDWEDIVKQSQQNLMSECTTDNLAYIIYTSGSTGQPKGVLVNHSNIVRLLAATQSWYNFNQQDVFSLFHSIAFDFSVWELWGALVYGGRLVIVPYWLSRSPEDFYKLLSQQQVTVLNQTPSAFRQLIQVEESLETANQLSLRLVIFGGEALELQSLRPWFERHGDQFPELVNMYGITETTVHVTYHPLTMADLEMTSGSVIGRPIPDLQVYLLDQYGQPVPIGVKGEMYIGGAGLARGYLNRPELTAQRFIRNSFSDKPNARLYKSGDLARYLPNGDIEYLGRIDLQVKIRGFRIELGEIEAVLSEHPQMREVVVLALEDVLNNKRLVAYLVTKEQLAPSISEIRNFLKEKLPEYMIPSGFVLLEAFPLTANGKVNRRALPALEDNLGEDQSLVMPRTPDEEIIANIFAAVLGVPQIGIYNNFFELGGHSLLATQVISRLRQAFGVEVPLRTLFAAPTVAEFAQALSALRQTASGLVVPFIKPFTRNTESLPLSWSQERLWFLDQLEGPSSTYNIPAALEITGQLNVVVLEQALNQLIQRHEVLRTSFLMVNGAPVQAIAPTITVTIPVVDLRSLPTMEQAAEVKRKVSESAQRPFDLTTPPLLRITILELGENSYVLLVTMHHIISDGWSIRIFIQELSTLYQTFLSKASSPLPDLPIQYADFAVWQRQWLKGEILENQLHYWKQQLAGIPSLLDLPTDRHRPPVQTGRGSTETFELNADLTRQLKELSQQSGTTLFMTLLAAFALLLSRYSRQEDIVVGSPIANRTHQEIESLIGIFINTLVLRVDLKNNPPFLQLLQRVRQMTLDAYAHQDLPFEKLVEALQPERSLSHHPLFQVMFVLHNTPRGNVELPGLTLTPLKQQHTEVAEFDLTLSMSETATGLVGTWEYNSDLFDADTIYGMMEHFQTLLKLIVVNSDHPVGQLSLLTKQQKHQLLVEWNNTQADFQMNTCVHQLFEQQAERTPDRIAVTFGQQQLTYQELNARANQLAHYLQAMGVRPEVLVGICIERSLEMVVGLLGILKAGGAYVPLDPTYPQERLKYMLHDAQVPVLLTQQKLTSVVPEHPVHMVCLDTQWEVISKQSRENPVSAVQASNLAYVIYTSGSTGKPKGVMISHQSLVNFTQAAIVGYEISACDRILQFASISFDTAAEEIYSCLTCGGMLVLRNDEMLSSVAEFLKKCNLMDLTVLNLPTAYWHQLTFELTTKDLLLPDSLRLVIIGGERALPEVVRMWQKLGTRAQLVNGYGPTEATIAATLCKLSGLSAAQLDRREVPIGRPFGNVLVYVLDQNLQPVPIGVPGELYIGGVSLARGYLNRPELTTEKFIPNPFSDKTGERLYKTGDLARYLPDGNIEFLGRIDNQVKIRGFRIELQEIEAVLNKHPSVVEVVVVEKEVSPGDKRLIAYIVPDESQILNNIDLRQFLREQLPDYMIPANFVMLKEMPLTPNGKINRRALPDPEISLSQHDRFVPPRNRLELELTQIWSEVLNVYPVGIQDNFFELGGHSLLAVSLMARIQQKLGQILPLTTLFQGATVEQQAMLLRQETDTHPWSSLVGLQPKGLQPPLFLIHPGGTGTFSYVRLAGYLSTYRPIYGLEPSGLQSGQEPHSQIEEMAAHYIKAIQTVQPNGPYLLAGWCMGGAIAFEMAQQLQNQGQETSLLALIEIYDFSVNSDLINVEDETDLLVPLFRTHLSLSEEELQQLEANLRKMDVNQQLVYAIEQAKQHNLQLPLGFGEQQLGRLLKLRKFHGRAAVNYVPQYYPGTVTLIQAREGNSANADNPILGWETLADKVELDWIPGDHYTIFHEPHVKVLAETLGAYLEQTHIDK